jgi:hypothetical protein
VDPLFEFASNYYLTHYVEMLDATTGDPKINVAHTDLAVSTITNRKASVALAVEALSAPDVAVAPRSTVGWVQVHATRNPGVYRMDLPDNVFTPLPSSNILDDDFFGNTQYAHLLCWLTIVATGCKTKNIPFQYVANEKNVSQAFRVWASDMTPQGYADGTTGRAFVNAFQGYQGYIGVGSGVPTGQVGLRLADDGLDSIVVEAAGGSVAAINALQAIRAILASTFGGRSGAGTGTTTVKSPAGTTRGVFDTPGDGNRTVDSANL